MAILLLLVLTPVLLLTWILALISSKSTGLFNQTRIGQYGKPFTIYKLQTMKNGEVTRVGKFLRKSKLDELPQLLNIIKGDMAFVGPRPDVPGYYDQLTGNYRRILELKPGITSTAAIKYRNEEHLLAQQLNPLHYNDTVIFPDKVRMNLEYLKHRSFLLDLKILWQTVFPSINS
jgi:lipopolysaccharide/colanic/teichoic acid biosynthesis glycosyltransferase